MEVDEMDDYRLTFEYVPCAEDESWESESDCNLMFLRHVFKTKTGKTKDVESNRKVVKWGNLLTNIFQFSLKHFLFIYQKIFFVSNLI